VDTDQRLGRTLHDFFAWPTTTTIDRFHGSADEGPPTACRFQNGRGTDASAERWQASSRPRLRRDGLPAPSRPHPGRGGGGRSASYSLILE
jgi:hypothetical protein